MQRAIEQLEHGRQIGVACEYMKDQESYWVTLAAQKYGDGYVAHISIINQKNMDAEIFERYGIYSFLNPREAVVFLLENSPVPIDADLLRPFKGQKAFNPDSEEIVDPPK